MRRRRRGGAVNARRRLERRIANPDLEEIVGEAPTHTEIRPTHVCKYGYRWELPARPVLGEMIEVRVFRPSEDQRQRRCDGCARSHHMSQKHCFATHGRARDAIIPADVSASGQPDDVPYGSRYVFHSLTHDKAGRYTGHLQEFLMARNGRNYKGGHAKIVITRVGA